ncbi:hypothetical protein [Streptomyces sp. NPDC088178]|uniref:hypothetical protein n=1 Tax=Streptomyces sp. NPDC088178 TaxID=3365836 RepID=UPI00380D41DE
MKIERAAWVPDDDPECGWDVAAALAVKWVEAECRRDGSTGVLVLNAFGADQTVDALRAFASRHICTTPRAGRNRVGRGIGPVLAYVPDARSLDFAMQLAHGSSIAVVESSHFPLGGWALELQAVNLWEPDRPVEDVDARTREAIDRLHFYANNGFGDQFGKKRATSIVRGLRDADLLDRGALIGALAARGVSDRAMKNLGQIIDRLH